jgi:hypothetical protein
MIGCEEGSRDFPKTLDKTVVTLTIIYSDSERAVRQLGELPDVPYTDVFR